MSVKETAAYFLVPRAMVFSNDTPAGLAGNPEPLYNYRDFSTGN
jgi:hypothetical protein